MFIVALFINTIARTWKDPKCPLTKEWIKTMSCIYIYITHTHTHTYIYIYISEYYSVIKKNEIIPFAARWMVVEMALSELSRQRQISYGIT